MFRSVLGEFDGDPATVEFVVFNRAAELRGASDPDGWHHMLQFRLALDGTIEFADPIALPSPRVIHRSTPPSTTTHGSWYLRSWPTSPDRPGLLLVRRWPAANGYEVEFSAHVLAQNPLGGFDGLTPDDWQPLEFDPFDTPCANRDPANNPDDRGIFCGRNVPQGINTTSPFVGKVLVSHLDEDDRPDPIITFVNSDGNPTRSSCLLLANRKDSGSEWRGIIDGLTVAELNEPGTAFTQFLATNTELVDLNGDDALDSSSACASNSAPPNSDPRTSRPR
jgi:hypothetical protein